MPSKTLNFGFFSVEIDKAQDAGKEFSKLLHEIALKGDPDRIGTVGSKTYRFRELYQAKKTNRWEGLISYIRMDKDPDKEDINTGNHEAIELEDSQGLSELQVFSFDEKYNTVVLQSRQLGITDLRFPDLIRSASDSNLSISLVPILTKNAYERAFKGQNITKFTAKASKPINPGNYGKINPVSHMLEYMDQLGGIEVEIIVRAAQKESLTAKAAKAVADYFLPRRDATKKLIAKVSDRSQPVNLLMDCIKQKVNVSIDDNRREVSTIELFDAVRTAWELQEEAIREHNSRTL